MRTHSCWFFSLYLSHALERACHDKRSGRIKYALHVVDTVIYDIVVIGSLFLAALFLVLSVALLPLLIVIENMPYLLIRIRVLYLFFLSFPSFGFCPSCRQFMCTVDTKRPWVTVPTSSVDCIMLCTQVVSLVFRYFNHFSDQWQKNDKKWLGPCMRVYVSICLCIDC